MFSNERPHWNAERCDLLYEHQSQLEASDESAAEDSRLNNKHQVLATSNWKKKRIENYADNVAVL